MDSDTNLDWDHLRVFLAVMRTKSMREAAQALGVRHPTVGRRISALETELDLRLFDRRPNGLHATKAAAELMDMAREVEATVHALRRRALDADPELTGPVRVSLPQTMATDLYAPAFAQFVARWPQIELRIQTGFEFVDLGKREADVVIRGVRHGHAPKGDLIGRNVGTAYAAIYGQNDRQWIGLHGEKRDREGIEKTNFHSLPITGRMPNFAVQRATCAAGMGLTRLPCFFAEPLLKRRSTPEPLLDIWVLVHADLRRSPRLRVFRDEMVKATKRLRARLQGTAAGA